MAAAKRPRALAKPGRGEPADPLLGAERALTTLEWSLWRLSAAFIRWQGECMSAVAGRPIGGHDTALLHVVAYQERAKGLSEIARLLGRSDTANIQYAVRKLVRLGLIAPLPGRSRKDAAYAVTAEGEALIRGYRALRRELLVAAAGTAEDDLPALDARLVALTGLYDGAARAAVQRQIGAGADGD